jgi:hypothetical protein
MANATININAVDNTRPAFNAVRAGLLQVKRQASEAGKGMSAAFSGRGLGSTLAAALGLNLANISKNIARTITGVTAESEKALAALVSATGRMADITEQRMRARRTDAEQMEVLQQREAARMKEIAALQEESAKVGARSGVSEAMVRLKLAFGLGKELESQDLIQARIAEVMAEMNGMAAEREGIEKATTNRMAALREQLSAAQAAAGSAIAPAVLKGKDAVEALQAQMGRLMADMAKGETDTEAGLKRQIELNKQLETVATRLTKAQENQRRISKEAGEILAGGFEEAIFSGEKLSKVINQLGQDILRLMFRNMITAPLANFFTGAIGGIFGGAFAAGGLPPTGKASIVGERGPELFVPGTSGRIVPNHELGGNGGGTTVYNIDARGADQTGLARLEAMIRQTQASIRPIALSSVMDARMRRPSFA